MQIFQYFLRFKWIEYINQLMREYANYVCFFVGTLTYSEYHGDKNLETTKKTKTKKTCFYHIKHIIFYLFRSSKNDKRIFYQCLRLCSSFDYSLGFVRYWIWVVFNTSPFTQELPQNIAKYIFHVWETNCFHTDFLSDL